jgi:hypothetical protein
VEVVRTLERLGLDPDKLLTRLLRCGLGETEMGYWEEYEVPALWWEGISVAFHCGVWLTLRRVGNLVGYEGECGSEERSSGGVDESDGCWAAIVARRARKGEPAELSHFALPRQSGPVTVKGGLRQK